jgi:hypothetical protein
MLSDMTSITVQGVGMSDAAADNVMETGIDVRADVDRIRDRIISRQQLFESCMAGADVDREDGWRDYVEAVCAVADNENTWRGIDPTSGVAER